MPECLVSSLASAAWMIFKQAIMYNSQLGVKGKGTINKACPMGSVNPDESGWHGQSGTGLIREMIREKNMNSTMAIVEVWHVWVVARGVKGNER